MNDFDVSIEPEGVELYDEFIDPSELPDDSVPWSKGALVASQEAIRRAAENCPPVSRRRKWHFSRYRSRDRWNEVHWIDIDPHWRIRVWRHGKLWFVSRASCPRQPRDQALVFGLGPSLFCANAPEAAQRLAEYYHHIPVDEAGGVLWVNVPEEVGTT
jgi:hypothetical protein